LAQAPAAPRESIQLRMMSMHWANRLFVTLVVAFTLLLCAVLPKALRDATQLLQYRSAQPHTGILRMNSSRQMSSPTAYLVTGRNCPTGMITSFARCQEVVKNVLGISLINSGTRASWFQPPGCFIGWFHGGVGGAGIIAWNSELETIQPCQDENVCVCDAAPPTKTETYLVLSSKCPTALAVPRDDCARRSHQVAVYNENDYSEVSTIDFPRGCVVIVENGVTTRVVFNNDFFSPKLCSANESCVCFGSKPPPEGVQPPVETTTTTTPVVDAFGDECRLCETPILNLDTCFNRAERLRYITTEKLEMFDRNYPEGCFVLKRQLWLNRHTETPTQRVAPLNDQYKSPRPQDGFTGPMCDSEHYPWGGPMACICLGQQVLNPQKISSGTCGTATPLAWCECERMATKLGTYTEFERINSSSKPARCFLDSANKLWWNRYLTSTVQCGNNGTECICAS